MTQVTFFGNPIQLSGDALKAGDQAPHFEVLTNDLSPAHLETYKGKVKLISVVPSLDTEVCDAQTRRFNQEVSHLDNVQLLTISADLPFAQKRWSDAQGLEHVVTLSDYRNLSFGQAYGVILKDLRLLTRAIFVVDSTNTIVYAEYVNEVTHHPDYIATLEAVKSVK
ncbi:thiol peroxidase [Bacillus thuringiensis]|uniref:thiol peroxidase n=1 Tax=Bacillus thuringiensis TaxID=1428 RepID=UPI000A398E56|nr:thiol peroxidase [Bacillus thuringiensis]OUA97978.1 lipid hydroperoxide peroxidase [Bacillus thuringiensis serovar leesis]